MAQAAEPGGLSMDTSCKDTRMVVGAGMPWDGPGDTGVLVTWRMLNGG